MPYAVAFGIPTVKTVRVRMSTQRKTVAGLNLETRLEDSNIPFETSKMLEYADTVWVIAAVMIFDCSYLGPLAGGL
jgi:hypothetical protein